MENSSSNCKSNKSEANDEMEGNMDSIESSIAKKNLQDKDNE